MRIVCRRCKQECFTTEEAHLCKDLARRLKRQTAQIEAVKTILQGIDDLGIDATAVEIVQALNHLGVTQE